MIEAIGHRQLGTYFATIDRLLAPDGLAGIQAILVPDQRYRAYRRQRDWIRKHIFPGGMLPSLEAITTAARRSSDLMVHDVREIGPHYARTLREWRERFLRAPRRGGGARPRPPLPAHLGVLPRVLRGGLRDARAARRAARADAAAQPHARRPV